MWVYCCRAKNRPYYLYRQRKRLKSQRSSESKDAQTVMHRNRVHGAEVESYWRPSTGTPVPAGPTDQAAFHATEKCQPSPSCKTHSGYLPSTQADGSNSPSAEISCAPSAAPPPCPSPKALHLPCVSDRELCCRDSLAFSHWVVLQV